MRKLLSIIAICILFIGCKPTTNEGIIKEKFKEYVKMNSDDPNNLKKVVSIEISDTIDYSYIREGMQEYIDLGEQAKKIDSISFDRLNGKEMNAKISKNGWKQSFQNIRFEVMNELIEEYEYIKNNKKAYEDAMKEAKSIVDSIPTIKVVHYEIKARFKEEGDLKLKTYHGYVYENGDIKILDRELLKKEAPDVYIKPMEILDKLMEESKRYGEFLQKRKKTIEKMEFALL